ncbi:hypothetical protein CLV89_1352 [Tritonibacter scottomollicae]|uniref:Uncharacterized protein n=1 Tax=Tritonibacter scottomollicae TaxID=483013 RepID=A0A2T1A175_TRISK|nr:hypothetical protein CLV89_1352 [Tritonibacter scottomollicae]
MASAMMSRPVGTTGPRLTFPAGVRDCASPRSVAALTSSSQAKEI